MRVLDPGHLYALDSLDGGCSETLRFVKRIGEKYPGNAEPAYSGTQTQEVIRALIDRTLYVDGQIQFPENQQVVWALRNALWWLERRAARVRGEFLSAQVEGLESWPTCPTCGHVRCKLHAQGAEQNEARLKS